MLVNNCLVLNYDELAKREWKTLFAKLRYVDADMEVYEPWDWNMDKQTITIPRGAWNLLPEHVEYEDFRVCPKARELKFNLELDAELNDGRKFERQKEAVRSMLLNEQGLVDRPPGTGKSQIALAFCAVARTNVVILVHTEDILQQWIEYAGRSLAGTRIGVIRADEFQVEQVTIATVQTFRKRLEKVPELGKQFGAVILDEAHHAPASTFDEILMKMHSRYRFGFTATVTRADRKHPYMKTVIGPVIHRVKFRSPVKVQVRPVKTRFYYGYRGHFDWGSLLRHLIRDPERNQRIARIADREVEKGNSVLVLSRRIEHLQRIAGMMQSFQDCGALLVGAWEDEDGTKHKLPNETRKEILKQFRAGEIKVVLATQLADESLDVPILSRVILTHPGKAEGRIIQQVGRALREHPLKTDAVIYDVYDPRISVLRKQWQRRKQHYRSMKIPIRKRRKRKDAA